MILFLLLNGPYLTYTSKPPTMGEHYINYVDNRGRDISITKFEDDWFLFTMSAANKSASSFWLCDQLDAVIRMMMHSVIFLIDLLMQGYFNNSSNLCSLDSCFISGMKL